MSNMKNNRVLWRVAAGLLMATAALWLAGCESDSVAPQDELPAMTKDDVAQQAGIVAAGLHKLGPQLLRFTPPKGKEVGVYVYEFPTEPYVTGRVTMEFFTGGAGGTHAAYDVADYGMLYTDEGEMLDITLTFPGDIELGLGLELDVAGAIDQVAGTADVSGGGHLDTDLFDTDFTFTNVVVTRDPEGYPDSGTLTLASGSLVAVVTFDGDDSAVIAFDGDDLFMVDLDTGQVSPI